MAHESTARVPLRSRHLGLANANRLTHNALHLPSRIRVANSKSPVFAVSTRLARCDVAAIAARVAVRHFWIASNFQFTGWGWWLDKLKEFQQSIWSKVKEEIIYCSNVPLELVLIFKSPTLNNRWPKSTTMTRPKLATAWWIMKTFTASTTTSHGPTCQTSTCPLSLSTTSISPRFGSFPIDKALPSTVD